MEQQETYRPTAAWLPTAQEIAEWTDGQVHDEPDAARRYTGLSTLAEAEASEISFVTSDKAIKEAEKSRAGLFLTSAKFDLPNRPRVVVDQVWSALAAVMRHLYPEQEADDEIHPTAVIGKDVKLGSNVSIGPYCVIGDGCSIGDGTTLGAQCIVDSGCAIGWDCRFSARVTLRGRVIVGDRVTIYPGAVLGADGFKYEVVEGKALKIPQVGAVIIEDDVEIGANTTIDRAFLHETRVGRGTKIDNQVQVAHNVVIGPGCLIAAQTGFGGSVVVGANCLFAGAVKVTPGSVLGNGVIAGGGSGVQGDYPDGTMLQGYPAGDMKEFWKISAAQRRLPDLLKRVAALERKSEPK